MPKPRCLTCECVACAMLRGCPLIWWRFARTGATMTSAAMATYAFGQIDHARADLNAVLK